jgi:hypothetical protein
LASAKLFKEYCLPSIPLSLKSGALAPISKVLGSSRCLGEKAETENIKRNRAVLINKEFRRIISCLYLVGQFIEDKLLKIIFFNKNKFGNKNREIVIHVVINNTTSYIISLKMYLFFE